MPQACGTHKHTHIPNKVALTQCQTLSNKCTKLGRGLSHKDRGRTGKVTAKHIHCVCAVWVCVWLKCNSCYRWLRLAEKKPKRRCMLHTASSSSSSLSSLSIPLVQLCLGSSPAGILRTLTNAKNDIVVILILLCSALLCSAQLILILLVIIIIIIRFVCLSCAIICRQLPVAT